MQRAGEWGDDDGIGAQGGGGGGGKALGLLDASGGEFGVDQDWVYKAWLTKLRVALVQVHVHFRLSMADEMDGLILLGEKAA